MQVFSLLQLLLSTCGVKLTEGLVQLHFGDVLKTHPDLSQHTSLVYCIVHWQERELTVS